LGPAQAHHQPVTRALQLGEREEVRTGVLGHRRRRRRNMREAAGDEPGELALELGHLRSQGLARGALGYSPLVGSLTGGRRLSIGRALLGCDHLPSSSSALALSCRILPAPTSIDQ
jgi:hypothetical protein